MGMAGSVAGGLPQIRTAETERSQQQAGDQTRRAQGEQHSEQAAGIGQTEEDAHVFDRDADGRRLWEAPEQRAKADEAPLGPDRSPSKDPTGERGGHLDLSG
jgi:hypothetical protein